MSHARIEEVSDSDPEIDDPTTFLPDPGSSIITPADIPSFTSSAPPTSSNPALTPSTAPLSLTPSAPSAPLPSRDAIKTFCCLYPLYFSSTRTRATGRRVPRHLAVPSPLARTILSAVQSVCGRHPLPLAFEPDKTHPRDWSNPGRVRVQLRHPETQKSLHPVIKNKNHLYVLVAEYLKLHPTTEASPNELQIRGVPTPEKYVPTAVPKGWRMEAILPLHSPAVSGGGVSENFFKDMMNEMGGELPEGIKGMAGMLGGGGGGGGSGGGIKEEGEGARKKKDKKDRKGKA